MLQQQQQIFAFPPSLSDGCWCGRWFVVYLSLVGGLFGWVGLVGWLNKKDMKGNDMNYYMNILGFEYMTYELKEPPKDHPQQGILKHKG